MLLIAAGYALLAAQEQRFLGQVFPVSVAVALMAFVMMHIMHTLYITKKWQRTSITPILGWGTAVLPLAAAVASVYVLGVALGILVFTTIFLSTVARVTLIRSLLAGLLTSSLPMLLGYVLSLRFPQGLINQYFTLPATLGG